MSLLQYLSQRLLLLGLVISAGIFYIVYILYQWGLDDSTEYYLQQDMQWAIGILENNQVLPNNTQFRQFYLTQTDPTDSNPTDSNSIDSNSIDSNSIDSNSIEGTLKKPPSQTLASQVIPEKYLILLAENKVSEYFYLEDDIAFQYGFQKKLGNGRALTVVHQFSIEEAATGLSLLEISIASSLLLILIMLLGAWFIYQRISLSMQHLHMAAQLTDTNSETHRSAAAEKEFTEIDSIVITLKNTLEKLAAKNEQERLFIQTLSHELRTPMATVQVALELLFKKELSSNVREKTEVIFKCNQQMQHLSNDLLSLWSNTEKNISSENSINEHVSNVDLEHELKQVINDLDKAFHCQQRFIITSENESCHNNNRSISKVHLKLLLNNLCKNAIVHSDSKIEVSIKNRQLIITNDKKHQQIDPLVAGSGIGLIIATRAAELLGWKLITSETEIKYTVCVLF